MGSCDVTAGSGPGRGAPLPGAFLGNPPAAAAAAAAVQRAVDVCGLVFGIDWRPCRPIIHEGGVFMLLNPLTKEAEFSF